jgi:hypothetical protein
MNNIRTFFDVDGDMDWSVVFANTSVTNNKGYIVDTSSGQVTLTLPGSPSIGDQIGIKDISNNFGTNNLTIVRNGKLIAGVASDKVVNTNGYGNVLVYSGDSNGWIWEVALLKGDVGLGNVDNTSDANKPVSTATQTALNLKADLASPTFTGTPAAPTPLTTDNSTTIATTAFVKAQVPTKQTVTGATTLVSNGPLYLLNTSAGTFTVTLPASASDGDTIVIYDIAGTFATNSPVIARNGHNIMSLAENLTLDVSGSKTELIYFGTTLGWRVFTN